VIVIDASALIEVLTVDPREVAELARRVRDIDWMSAPSLIDYETLNVLRTMVARADIDSALADDARLALRDLRLTRHALTDELTERMWQLRHSLTAYDAAYIALAEQLDVPLITTDRRLADGAASLTSVPIERYETT
jgi:predicted nucleic acid-binding protein